MPDTIIDVANWAQPDVDYAQPAREQVWDAGSSQLADWIIEDANQQAAELQATAIRATTMKLTTELTAMAAYVTQNLTPAPPAPASAPQAPAPSTFPPPATTTRIAQPTASPVPQPPPAARPGGQPNAKSRQHAAVRVATVVTAAMVLFALTAGCTEVALHGFKFFV